MSRHLFKGVSRDGAGNVISGATVSVYLTGTTTAASVYTASTGGTAVNSVTSATSGAFTFYVDESDYGYGQLFDLSIAKTGYSTATWTGVEVIKLPWTTGAGTPKFYTYQADALADDGTITLPDATSGFALVSCNAECGLWGIQSDGTVTKISGSTNTAATDSDGDLCIYDGGTGAIVKNRLGATGEIRVFYMYN